jgi:hypothetical protein
MKEGRAIGSEAMMMIEGLLMRNLPHSCAWICRYGITEPLSSAQRAILSGTFFFKERTSHKFLGYIQF